MTREEAITVLKKVVNPKVKEAIETLIPELRESEDEKTKRMLNTITYKMSQHQPDIFTEEENEWFNAYLERQKEPKNTSASTVFPSCWAEEPSLQKEQKPIHPNIEREYIEKRLKGLIDKEGEYYRGAREELAHLFYILGGQPSQYLINNVAKEEWSEEDEKIAKEIEEELWYPGDFPDYPSKEESELYDDCQRRLDWFKNKLKSLRERFNSKKCNKEMDLDTKLQNRLEEISRNGLENAHTIDFSKEYENSKQILEKSSNSTEWSEENKQTIRDAINRIEQLDHFWNRPRDEKLIKRIKSLRLQKLDASKLENFDPVDVLNRIKTEWPMAWEKVVGKEEWSEEDEKMRQSIIKDIEFDRNYTYATTGKVCEKYNEQINWLKVLSLNRKKINEGVEKLCSNEWSEEDEKTLWGLTAYIPDEELVRLGVTRLDILKKFKSLRPQPKVEWSEEEYGRLFDIEHYLDGTLQLSPDRKIACIDFLKSLRPQQNHAWSEEDEKMLDEIIRDVMTLHNAKNLDELKDKIDFLKSCRPHLSDEEIKKIRSEEYTKGFNDAAFGGKAWKPSEQEKGALRTAIHILTDERSFPKAAAHLQDILNAFEGKESRKDWKPSEVQMTALEGCLEHWSGNKYQKEILESLCEQLKERM